MSHRFLALLSIVVLSSCSSTPAPALNPRPPPSAAPVVTQKPFVPNVDPISGLDTAPAPPRLPYRGPAKPAQAALASTAKLPSGALLRVGVSPYGDLSILGLTADGKRLLVRTDKEILVADARTLKRVRAVAALGPGSYLSGSAMAPDGERFALLMSSGDREELIVERVSGPPETKRFPLKDIDHIVFATNTMVLAHGYEYGADHHRPRLTMVDLTTGTTKRRRLGDAEHERLATAALSTDGTLAVVLMSRNGKQATGQLIDLASGKVKHSWETRRAERMIFSDDGKRLAELSSGKVTVRDVSTGQLIFQREAGSSKLLKFEADGSLWIYRDGLVRYSAGGALMRRLHTFSSYARFIAIHSDLIVAASTGDEIMAWDTKSEQPVLFPTTSLSLAFSDNLAFSADGKRLLTYDHRTLDVIDVRTGRHLDRRSDGYVMWNVRAHPDRAGALHELIKAHQFRGVLSHDGRHLVVKRLDTIELWNLDTREQVRTLTQRDGDLYGVSPRGLVLLGGYKESAGLYELPSLKKKVALDDGKKRYEVSYAFSHDGRHLIGLGEERNAFSVFDTTTGAVVNTFDMGEMIVSAAYSPNDATIAVGLEKSVRLIHASTGATQREILHDDYVRAVAFSPDGKRLATQTSNGATLIWRN